MVKRRCTSRSRRNMGRGTRSLTLESLEVRLALAADPVLTEFLASNSNGLLDGRGNASDWIEIYNAGDASIDLSGWYLTDDIQELDKWQFPDVAESDLGGGEYLVVFASGDDAADPLGNLHTNFRLDSAGENLALVNPALEVHSQIPFAGGTYPEQHQDVSYGYVGSSEPIANAIQYYDADEAPGGNTSGLYGGWVPRGAGASNDSSNFANEGGALQGNGVVGALSTTVSGLNENTIYDAFVFFWSDSGNWHVDAGLTSGALTHFAPGLADVFAVDATTQVPGAATFVNGLNVLGQSPDDYSDWVDGNRTLYAGYLGQTTGSTDATVYIERDNSASSDRSWYDGIGLRPVSTLIDAVSPIDYLIPADGSLGTTWTSNTFDPATGGGSAGSFQSGQASIGYENNPNGNASSFADTILTTVPSGTTSVYMRMEFDLAEASDVTDLRLNLKYDDGFVAYLNGVQVASRFAPTPANYNSTATSTGRSDAESLQFEEFVIASYVHLLEDGQNTLAIHALNTSAGSSDFLMSVKLDAARGSSTLSDIRYLPTPTPGSLNGTGILGYVGDTQFDKDRGFYDAPFAVTITSTTQDADIYYTVDGSDPSDTSAATLYTGPIAVSTTTTLRAIATRPGYESSNVDTQTYLFLDDVFAQNPIGNPQNGLSYPTTWQGGYAGDYTVDSRVVSQWDDNNPTNTDFGIREGLTSIPTMSLVLDHADLWGTGANGSGGIYPNATSSGSAWRRPGSVEYWDPNTGESFQYGVGIQMQGAASRDNARLLKHSFRLVFNEQYGPGRLNFPLFDNSDFDDINTVSLKASFTDAFATRSVQNRYSPLDSLYMRDTWMRDSQLAMGHLAGDSTYVHLYINGLYWGLYWPAERVDDAYLSSRIGGEREDWDIIRDFNELFRGNRTAYDQMFSLSGQIDAASPAVADELFQRIQGKNPDGTDNPSYPALLDVDNFIDYLVLHLYAGVEDWPSHNWYAARNRVDPGKGFQFFTWDQEIALDQLYRDRTSASNGNTPGELFQDLRNSSEFRLRFADRVQKHLFHDGALTTSEGQERFMKRANQIEAAIIGESARWGDAREGQTVTAYSSLGPFNDGHIPTGSQTIPLMTVDHWRDARDYVHDNFLVNANGLLVSRLTSDGLYTSLAAPEFSINGINQHGGAVTPGSSLGISGSGTVYYTLDGSDPRDIGGAIAGTAYVGVQPLDGTVVVNARSYLGGQWSALTRATFVVPSDALVISEIHYNPLGPQTSAELALPDVTSDDFEFLEIMNTHPTESFPLLGSQFTDGVSFTFGNITLGPGERAVIVENQAAFAARYGSAIRVLGEWSGGLSNGGETLTLSDAFGGEIHSVTYNDVDPWPVAADGAGTSLELTDPNNTPPAERSKHYRWSSSFPLHGTPAQPGVAAVFPVINEIVSNTDAPNLDSIEIHNPLTTPVDIGGWLLSDSRFDLGKFSIPPNTVLPAGGFLTFDESDFNNPASPTPSRNFALDSVNGEDLYLTIPDAGGNPQSIADAVSFDGAFTGQSYGRFPDGTGVMARMDQVTLGAANAAPVVGPLVISELHYHPPTPSQAALAVEPTLTTSDLEFVEIHNPTAQPVDLTNWRLVGEVDFDFPSGATISPLGRLVLVSFDPADPVNLLRVAAFHTQFGVTGLQLAGPFTGKLSNSQGRITLQQPDNTASGSPTDISRIVADEIIYDDLAPWSIVADGYGPTLNRTGPTMYGNVASAWYPGVPTPGAVDFVPTIPGDYDRNGTVEHADYLVWTANFSSTIAVNADGNGNGIVDAADFTVWRDHLGDTIGAASVTLPPSPDSGHSPSIRIDTTGSEEDNGPPADGTVDVVSASVVAQDVDGNGQVQPLDALMVINWLNTHAGQSGGPVSDDLLSGQTHDARDVNRDGQISPIDALLVINVLNRNVDAGQTMSEPLSTSSLSGSTRGLLVGTAFEDATDDTDDESVIDAHDFVMASFADEQEHSCPTAEG